MKKLLLLITTVSFFSVVAMDQPSLIKDPNAQNQQVDTQLHNTVIAWQKSNSNAQEKAREYADLNKQYKQIQREISIEQAKNRTHNNELVVLDAKCQTVLEKANIVKTEHAQHKKQADSCKKTAVQLIKNGAYINIPKLNLEAVLVKEIVYDPLRQAVMDGDLPTIERYLRIGANPDFVHEDGMIALQYCIERNNPEAAQKLLFGGAKFTSTIPFANGTATVLHLAANRGTYKMTQTLLESPQASPSFHTSTYDERKTQQEMFTFLCCMQRNKETLSELPQEVVRHIYRFVLPTPATLIDSVPLQQLPKYKKFLDKTTLINALTKRHMELIGTALTIKSNIPNFTLSSDQFPRLHSFNEIDLHQEMNAVQRALDPAKVEQHRAAITANYAKLLE